MAVAVVLLSGILSIASSCDKSDDESQTEVLKDSLAGNFIVTNVTKQITIIMDSNGLSPEKQVLKVEMGDSIKLSFEPKSKYSKYEFSVTYNLPNHSYVRPQKGYEYGFVMSDERYDEFYINMSAKYEKKDNDNEILLYRSDMLKVEYKIPPSSDFMATFICPVNIFDYGDVVISYYGEGRNEVNDTLRTYDFTLCQDSYLALTLSGDSKLKVDSTQMYWQKRFHYNQFNVQQRFLIWFIPAVSSYRFTSFACFDAVTKGLSGNNIETLPFELYQISSNGIGVGIGSDPNVADKNLIAGVMINVDSNGKISSKKVTKEDFEEHL